MYNTSQITGAIILNQIDKASIGKWTEAKINAEKTTNDTFSVIGLAVEYYTKIASDSNTSLTGPNETLLNTSLVWYIAGQFKKRDIEDKRKELCTEDDYRYQANLYNRACELLKKVSASMASLADFCKFEESLNIDSSLFTVEGHTVDCGEVVDL